MCINSSAPSWLWNIRKVHIHGVKGHVFHSVRNFGSCMEFHCCFEWKHPVQRKHFSVYCTSFYPPAQRLNRQRPPESVLNWAAGASKYRKLYAFKSNKSQYGHLKEKNDLLMARISIIKCLKLWLLLSPLVEFSPTKY